MTNLENTNKSINNLAKDVIDGKELKGGGTPGAIGPMEVGDVNWLDPNDSMSGIQHANQIEGDGQVVEANNGSGQFESAILNPLLSPSPTNNPSI